MGTQRNKETEKMRETFFFAVRSAWRTASRKPIRVPNKVVRVTKCDEHKRRTRVRTVRRKLSLLTPTLVALFRPPPLFRCLLAFPVATLQPSQISFLHLTSSPPTTTATTTPFPPKSPLQTIE